MAQTYRELDRLWEIHHKDYLQGDGEYSRNQLIKACLPQIKKISRILYKNYNSNIELDDLIQEGVLGAINAIKFFNPNKAKFITYLDKKIKSSILDYFRKEDWVPRTIRKRNNQLEKAKSKLGYNHTEKELIEELSNPLYFLNPFNKKKKTKLSKKEKAKRIIKQGENINKQIYFSSLLDENSDKLNLLKDNKTKTPIENLETQDFKYFLSKVLTRDKKLLLDLYYLSLYNGVDDMGRPRQKHGASLKEIGELIGISESGTSQLNSKIIKELKKYLEKKELTLEDCLDNL